MRGQAGGEVVHREGPQVPLAETHAGEVCAKEEDCLQMIMRSFRLDDVDDEAKLLQLVRQCNP